MFVYIAGISLEHFSDTYQEISSYFLHGRSLLVQTTEKHMVAIEVDQSLSNSALYEHKCMENTKKLYKTAGK